MIARATFTGHSHCEASDRQFSTSTGLGTAFLGLGAGAGAGGVGAGSGGAGGVTIMAVCTSKLRDENRASGLGSSDTAFSCGADFTGAGIAPRIITKTRKPWSN